MDDPSKSPISGKSDRERSEADVKALIEAGDVEAAATQTIRIYGGEIFGWLSAICRSEDDAGDVFSIFSERVWKGLSKFHWESSLRTWVYVVARNASHRFGRDRGRRAKREVQPKTGAFDDVVQEVRTRTLTHLRTDTKSEIRRLREELSTDDQTLLILRIDRDLDWADIARVFLDADSDRPSGDDALKREAARLRKRFQLVKEKLTKLGRERGLITKR